MSLRLVDTLIILFFFTLANQAQAVVGMNQKVFEHMQKAQVAAEVEDFDQAHDIISGLQKRRKLNEHELAQVKNLEGNIYTLQKNYGQAIRSFETIVNDINRKNIPEGLVENALQILMQLSMVNENYAQAIEYSDQLLATKENPDSNLMALRGQCFYHQEQYDEADDAIVKAINIERTAGDIAKENWLLLLNAIHHFRSDYPAMVSVLNDLIRDYPNDKYIYNLAAVYGQLERQKEQLLLLEPLYESGFLTQKSQKMLLAQLFLAEGVPVKAAQLLDQELDWRNASLDGDASVNQRDLEMLAQAWVLAKEPQNAIEPLELAGKLSDNGEAYIRLAHTHISLSDWAGAEQAIRKALDKGELRNQGNAVILLGMSQYRQKEFNQAIKTFSRAQDIQSVAEAGDQWLRYVKDQRQKYQLAKIAQ